MPIRFVVKITFKLLVTKKVTYSITYIFVPLLIKNHLYNECNE